ncbi:MAG: hypothetical protein ACI8PQ_000507 [Planctomycetota bacterium]|jgi:hypothetical protein
MLDRLTVPGTFSRVAQSVLCAGALLCGVQAQAALSADVASQDGNAGKAGSIEFVDLPEGVGVTVDGELFTILRHDAQVPYLYPVLGPAGTPVTRGYPMDLRPGEAEDHPHHRSLWLAHGSVQGFDFWHGNAHGERIRLIGEVQPVPEQPGVLQAEYSWEAEGKEVLREERRLTFEVKDGQRSITLATRLTASGGSVIFGDTKEGTMAVRLAPTLRLSGDVAEGFAQNSSGDLNGDAWGKRAAWVAYSGPVEGLQVTVAIFDSPLNPRFPTWWHARDYGLVAANPFGAHDFEKKPAGTGDLRLEKGSSIEFTWRIVIRSGAAERSELIEEYTHFSEAIQEASISAVDPIGKGYPLVYTGPRFRGDSESDWLFSDREAWKTTTIGDLELLGGSKYTPAHRSPLNIALLKTPLVGDFVLEAELKQTGREYGHRDLCLFFGFEGASRYYYAHLATKPDPNAHNVMLVDNAPRRNLLEPLAEGVDWGEDEWHRVRVERNCTSGLIRVFFDDMETPKLEVNDTTLGFGRVGFGSFDDQGLVRRIRLWAPETKPAPQADPFGEGR